MLNNIVHFHRFTGIIKWIDHLRQRHTANIKTDHLSFASSKEFLTWKEDEELKTDSQYAQKCSPRLSGTCRTWYFYCNRAGIYVSRGKNIRQLKSQGTSKIGKQCTAHIKAKQNNDTGRVEVTYCGCHTHPIRLSHILIPKQNRLDIAAKLQSGVSMDRILNDIRDSVNDKLGRKHLIRKQDLYNIRAQFSIDDTVRHQNDAASVMAWVEEMGTLDYNPVLAYKPQGVESTHVSTEDFLLVLQTEFQCEMMKRFGSDAVCIDSTHGTNAYHFNLTTIMVIDDYGEGLPVGWMVSNKEDKNMLVHFFAALKRRAGSINPKWFMTDDAEQYHNAWKEVFEGEGTRKILCAWHVDRAWRKALQQHISEQKEQVHVYHQLNVLLSETDEAKFRVTLQEFLTYIERHHFDFYIYFSGHYGKRIDQWASCYRKYTVVNTNMFVEAFHRVLKIVYFCHKQNRRIDVLLVTLLRISRDKAFEWFYKVEKGKWTHRICEINRRHKAAIMMVEKAVIADIPDEQWTMNSDSRENTRYTIRRQITDCNCRIMCSSCQTCTHNFSCTCLDSTLRSTVCKHIHYLMITGWCAPITVRKTEKGVALNTSTARTLCQGKQNESELKKVKQRIHELNSEIHLFTEKCNDIVQINILKQRLQATLSLVKIPMAKQNPAVRYAPNANHQKQLKFHSTRKRNRPAMHKLTKPSKDELCQQRFTLDAEIPTFCGICLKEDDEVSDEVIDWIQCSKCSLWMHEACTDRKKQATTDDYFCQYCS